MPAKNDHLEPFLQVLRDLVDWLETSQVPYALIGGIAASALGRPRVTRDVDVLVLLEPERWESFLSAGIELGFQPRIRDAIRFARKSRVLLVQHAATSIEVDVSLGLLPFELETIERASAVPMGSALAPRLATPEDLIVMKAVAGRGRDMADIEGLLDLQKNLDVSRIRECAREFASLTEQPQILTNLEALLAKSGRK